MACLDARSRQCSQFSLPIEFLRVRKRRRAVSRMRKGSILNKISRCTACIPVGGSPRLFFSGAGAYDDECRLALNSFTSSPLVCLDERVLQGPCLPRQAILSHQQTKRQSKASSLEPKVPRPCETSPEVSSRLYGRPLSGSHVA